MKKWTKTAGLIFMAAASVYSDRAIAAKPAKPANSAEPATDVKLLEATDPFAAVAPTTEPTTPTAATETENKAPAALAKVNDDGTFSLNITAGADVVEQLRVIGFQAQESIIPSKDVRGALPAMDLYNVTVHEALDALLHANGFAWREKGKFIYVYSAKEIADMEQAARVKSTQVFRLYYVPAADAAAVIKGVLSDDGEVAMTAPAPSGIPTGTAGLGGNSYATEDLLVVTDYAENLSTVAQVLKEVDRRPEQILVEATILRASLNEDNALGVDFNVVGGVDFSAITSGASAQIGNSGLPGGPIPPGGNTVSSVGTGNNFSSSVTNGFKVGVVTDNISVFLSALEGVTDTTVLANPKVLALNKQKGEVIVGREDGYLTTTVTESSSTQTVEFLKTGTRLIFRPYISDDGYIRMEVHPEDSSGGLQTADNLPYKTTTEVTSNVMVKDGHTIVIGGLFRESSDSTRSQIPLLGNLPLAGPLFRQQRDSTKREEVIILLTPHIVKDDAAYAALSTEQMKAAEQLRVGVRKGMMMWGRERLAEMYYEQAMSELNKPRPNRFMARWNLDSATNLNPQFIEAIKLKQDLTGREVTESDRSSIRSFVREAIMKDQIPATQPTVMAAPATQPVAQAQAPATQPVAQAPSTQPAFESAAADSQQDESVAGSESQDQTAEMPSTQPAIAGQWQDENWNQQEENATQTTVTEMPIDELPGAFAPEDANK